MGPHPYGLTVETRQASLLFLPGPQPFFGPAPSDGPSETSSAVAVDRAGRPKGGPAPACRKNLRPPHNARILHPSTVILSAQTYIYIDSNTRCCMRKRLIRWLLVSASVGGLVFVFAGTWRDPWLWT